MNILGIIGRAHDSGVALVTNGVPDLILEEERFNRQKHTQLFPHRSLTEALDKRGLHLRDIDVITMPWDTKRLRRTFLACVTGRLPASLNLLWPSSNTTQQHGIVAFRSRLAWELKKRYGLWRLRDIVEVGHHESHAASFFVSPFEEAAVLVMDGYGDETSTSAWSGRGNRLERLWHGAFFDSLGMLYTCATLHLGFKPFEEGTIMALAACGGPTYAAKFREIFKFEDEGRYTLDRGYINFDTHGFLRPFTRKFYETFGPPRRPDEPLTDRHRDLAYALQHATEDAILHIVRALSKKDPSRNLCLAGGVALNCVANARILRDTDYTRVWVPPCASDTGAPLGSTLWHWHQTLGNPRGFEMTHPFYGLAYTDAEIVKALDAAGLKYERMEEGALIGRVAQDLARRKIAGWFQGRFEMGPRALGNRSILSDSRDAKIKDLINARIKHREAFRPFAPAVLIERAAEFFEIDQPDPFMTMAPRVRPDKVHVIPAAVHVDGTGRIQTVSRAENPRYYGVIEKFAELTGVPVILNTSFNRQEPIVASPAEAISCYLRTDMDVLVLGDYYCADRNADAARRAHEAFGRAIPIAPEDGD